MLPHTLFKLLSDDTRIRCLLLIAREKRLCVCELTHALQESQPKISRHLAQLRQSGILIDERQGQWVFYQLASDLPDWINQIIGSLAASNCVLQNYPNDKTRLAQMPDRPCC